MPGRISLPATSNMCGQPPTPLPISLSFSLSVFLPPSLTLSPGYCGCVPGRCLYKNSMLFLKVTASRSQWCDAGARVAGGGVTIREKLLKLLGRRVLQGGS